MTAMTPERALLAARNSDLTGWVWRADGRGEDPFAHQFPTTGADPRSRCDAVRWTLRWWTAADDARLCPTCCEMSEATIAREVGYILAWAARNVPPSELELRYAFGDR